MIKTDSRQKVQTPSIEPSVKHPTGAVITTFKPPPADFDPMTADPATLRNYGYPPRPRDPAALARWRELLGRFARSGPQSPREPTETGAAGSRREQRRDRTGAAR
jgi:hypothetical protein